MLGVSDVPQLHSVVHAPRRNSLFVFEHLDKRNLSLWMCILDINLWSMQAFGLYVPNLEGTVLTTTRYEGTRPGISGCAEWEFKALCCKRFNDLFVHEVLVNTYKLRVYVPESD
jgi:hypothetical protein